MTALLRRNRTATEAAPRAARVVISMKNVKPLSREDHQRLRADARDPKLAMGRNYPKIKA